MQTSSLLLSCAAAAALAACVSPQQRAVNECQAIGLAPGSAAFNDCYQQSMDRSHAASMMLIDTGARLYNGASQRPAVWTGSCQTLGNSTYCSGTR